MAGKWGRVVSAGWMLLMVAGGPVLYSSLMLVGVIGGAVDAGWRGAAGWLGVSVAVGVVSGQGFTYMWWGEEGVILAGMVGAAVWVLGLE